MLPSVSPLTSSPKKRLQFTGERFHKTSAAPRVGGRTPFACEPLGLRDPDEDSLDRVVDTERLLDHVAVPVEGDGKAEQRRLGGDPRPLDLRTNLGAGRRAVFAGTVDRARDGLRRHVARGAAEARRMMDPLERRDPTGTRA